MSTLHALLIGIDDYAPGFLPGGTRYPSLHGATRDVERVESFLRDQAGLTAERTCKLLSRVGEDGQPTQPPERLPTYANLVAAFKRLAAEAAPGDRVYVHYSGHGARVTTEYPEIKGTAGQDEALVPCDIGEPGSRYLRDLELAVLVRLLVDWKLLVTLVLDSCHSGGAMRTGTPPDAVPRRVPGARLPPVPSAVARRDLLMRAWRHLQQEEVTRRNLSAQTWLPVARYALFAACRPEELAYEFPFEKGEPQGALTYCLLQALGQNGLDQSCDAIQKKLVANVHGTLKSQTPMLIGDGDCRFLAEAPVHRQRTVSPEHPIVLRVGEDGRVLLSWGQAQGARERDRLVLRGPSGTRREFVVRQVGPTESVAQVIDGPKPSTIPPGSCVEVLPLQTAIRLLPPEPGDSVAERALEQIREALWKYREGFLEIDDEADAPDLCVAFTRGAYEIRGPEGSPLPNVAPVRAVRGAPYEVVRRLDHLVKFRGLSAVENPEPPHWLEIGLELCGDDPSAASVPFPSGGLDLKCGEAATLRIVNRSSLRLDVVVLDLAPDYSVTQLLPPRRTLSLLPLDPGEGHMMRVKGCLPGQLQEGVDILKIFATRGFVSYRWLELPPLGRPDPERTMRGGWTPSEFPEEEWISQQVEIRVRR
ncbi:MAG TPA: caspase family protein [Thermoanaerobaculia bacterium]|nr:caspase family protein [Thermoanaerobaculia bacterium]